MFTKTMDSALAALLFGTVVPLYLFNLAPSTVPGDSGELAKEDAWDGYLGLRAGWTESRRRLLGARARMRLRAIGR